MSGTKGFLFRDVSPRSKAENGRTCVNFGKTLPASTIGNIFTIVGCIQVTSLVGIVSTVLQASNVSPTIGVTGLPAAIAAAPAAPYNALAVGSVLPMPLTAGGALPAAVVGSGNATAACRFIVNAAAITITTATTVTGAITWVLSYAPLSPKGALVAVTAV